MGPPPSPRRLAGELTGRHFRGDPAALVNHLPTENEIEPSELARLRALIETREREGDAADA